MPTVHFTSTAQAGDPIDDEALSLLDRCRSALVDQSGRFVHVDDSAAADLVVFIEPPRYKFAGYARALLAHPAVQNFADRCFAYDWADGTAGFLPGVYPSLRRSQWDPARLVPGGFLQPYNEAVTAAARGEPSSLAVPRRLLSFRGSASHNVRLRLRDTPSVVDDPEVDFSLTPEWFTHSVAQKAAYAEQLLDARFALCPRGVGPATFRVYEAMALGRAPVIVSDAWIAPAGPDWAAFALIVGEDRLADLPDIVRERERDWEEMGRLAHQTWEGFFAMPVAVTVMLKAIEQISLARPRGETLAELRARWRSRRFKSENGWATSQRVGRVIKSGDARERVRRRVARRASGVSETA